MSYFISRRYPLRLFLEFQYCNISGENIIKPKILKTNSEGDLSKIDRVATFGTSPVIEPSELLARVVDALGTTCGLSSVTSSSTSSLSSLGADEYLRQVSKFSI